MAERIEGVAAVAVFEQLGRTACMKIMRPSFSGSLSFKIALLERCVNAYLGIHASFGLRDEDRLHAEKCKCGQEREAPKALFFFFTQRTAQRPPCLLPP
jgi:hypothetical protein